MWRVRSDDTRRLVTPDGVMDLVWFQDRLIVAGADTHAMAFETRPGEPTWGLQLAPGVAHALLGLPVRELTNQRIELSELVGLRGGLAAFEHDPPAGLEEVFVALWRQADPDRSLLHHAESLDRAARNGMNVRDTAAIHHVSQRSLHRISTALFGYGLNTLTQIHRLQRALQLTHSGLSLSDAAATAGYVDQSHFTRQAKRLTGQTPAELTSATSS